MNKPQPNLKECRDLLLKCGWKEPVVGKEYSRCSRPWGDDVQTHYFIKFECDPEEFLVRPNGFLVENERLPSVNTCLTSWYQWVWPVLREKKIEKIVFIFEGNNVEALIYLDVSIRVKPIYGEGPTKIAALVAASMEALG